VLCSFMFLCRVRRGQVASRVNPDLLGQGLGGKDSEQKIRLRVGG
jgi:hypothetical protein